MPKYTVHQLDWDRARSANPGLFFATISGFSAENHELGGAAYPVVKLVRAGLYSRVAVVEAIDLEGVYHATNTIEQPWWHNAGVERHFAGAGCRSTSVGDLIVAPDGSIHRVASFGMEALPADHDVAKRLGLE